jgi:hypothetical protein
VFPCGSALHPKMALDSARPDAQDSIIAWIESLSAS